MCTIRCKIIDVLLSLSFARFIDVYVHVGYKNAWSAVASVTLALFIL